ncbi:ribosomal silencing factor RsfS [Marinobacterium nitratireducens]|uniref:Ribosomal silencing factor RsfS n=1 Tax=Marinobacterium nitratireducens TaxID=518897 RepID=A0A917ZBP9_9GAMM|nr:ribosome silencing factor [Marinobacterium nitratireducens]GGO78639.1 ribosomal silencing factor RsfS [Marinobacterium nitratireducens]
MQIDQLIKVAQQALEDMKAKDVVLLDVQGKSSVTDFMLIASGTSRRHVNSIADEVVEKVKEAGLRPLGTEGQETGDWILVDLGDLVVHVMMPDARSFYDLERLWRFEEDTAEASE